MTILGLLALAQAVAWLPIFARFLRSWRQRKNPISLAIGALVLLAAYVGVAPYWLGEHVVSSDLVAYGLLAGSWLVLINFYVATVWANRKFKDERSGG